GQRLGFWERDSRTRTEEIAACAARQVWTRQCNFTSPCVGKGATCFGDRLFLQRRSNVGGVPYFVRQTELSELRGHPGGRRVDRQYGTGCGAISEDPLYSSRESRLECCAKHRRNRGQRRGYRLHRFGLYGRSGLALLLGRNADQWGICRRWRT